MLTTREWASLAWLAVILLLVLASSGPRKSLLAAAKTLVQPVFVVILAVYAVWVVVAVLTGLRIGLWDVSMLSATLVWAVTAGIALLFSFDAAAKDRLYVVRKIRDLVALTVLLEFLVNLHEFSFIGEFLLQGALGFVIILSVVASSSPSHSGVAKVVNASLVVAGLVFLGLGAAALRAHGASILTWETARSVALPIWLGVALLPLVVALGMYSNLDRVFRMMGMETPSVLRRLLNVLPLAIALSHRPDQLHSFRNYWERQLALAPSMREAWKVVREYKIHRRREAEEERAKLERLRQYADVKGTDEEGRQLDQREFEATKEALRWIHNRHHGWYSREPVGYKAAKIQGFLDEAEFRGLPKEHGIVMRVEDGGRSWYAWRRTVGGWVLALGAREGDFAEWLYDGPEPPSSFPHESDEWGRTLFQRLSSTNW